METLGTGQDGWQGQMIRVAVEVRESTALSRVVIRAESISDAIDAAQGGLPGREVRVVFPIDADGFFEPGRPASTDAGGGLGDQVLAGGHHEEGGVHEQRLTGRGDV
jgi:hypothetical protein